MEVMLGSTLAGGVAIGTVSNIIINPGVALAIGCVAGIISAFGILRIKLFLSDVAKLHDTSNVQYTHGIPGVFGAIVGAIATSFVDSVFLTKEELTKNFPATAEGRTSTSQAWYQLGALGLTIFLAIIGGVTSGLAASFVCKPGNLFDDRESFRDADYVEEEDFVKRTDPAEEQQNHQQIELPDTDRNYKQEYYRD